MLGYVQIWLRMIVTSFGDGKYRKGLQRLKESLEANGVPHMLFTNFAQLAPCPTHRQSPYEFKIHAIKKAWQVDKHVLWCDASMFLVGDIKRIANLIEYEGYFMEEAGHYIKDWCNPLTQTYFNFDKQTPLPQQRMFSAGLLGLNRDSLTAQMFMGQWQESADAGCFKGSWKDHRHDMTCGSIIANQLGMQYQTGGTHLRYCGGIYGVPKEGAVFHCQHY